MRILFIGHSGYGYPHTRVRCYHFAKMLSTMPGVETSVLSFRDDLAPHKSEAAMYENLRDREKLWLTGKAIRRLLGEKDSIFYIQKAHFHAAAPFLLHRLGLSPHYILDYDDYDIPLSNFFGRGIWNRLFFGSNRWDEITFRLARRASACVTASRALQEILEKENARVAYIPTGVDDRIFTPRQDQKSVGPLTFLWNGLVWGEPILKNLSLLLKAFAYAAPDLPDARLLLVGGGASWKILLEWIETEYRDLPIVTREWVDPQEMPEIVRHADVGLLPLEGDDLWLKCKSPTKLFEYMACGLPVIASPVGEAAQVLDHLESGFLARNVNEFAEGIIRLARNRALREKLGMQARQVVEKRYSLPILGENLYLFLREVFPER